jgi:hypothetical protein
MNYTELIETVSEVVNNKNIHKEGLVLVYELDSRNHMKLDEHLFYESNPDNTTFVHKEVLEVEMGGVRVRFIKKDLED